HFNRILEINAEEKWVRVQPGVIRDDLNKHLAPYQLLFGPETSTASRAMIGGMIGNNSCGLHSITWGATRDHVLELKAILSDGEEVHFKNLTRAEFQQKVSGKGVSSERERAIYAGMWGIVSNPVDEELIRKQFPKKRLLAETQDMPSTVSFLPKRGMISISASLSPGQKVLFVSSPKRRSHSWMCHHLL